MFDLSVRECRNIKTRLPWLNTKICLFITSLHSSTMTFELVNKWTKQKLNKKYSKQAKQIRDYSFKDEEDTLCPGLIEASRVDRDKREAVHKIVVLKHVGHRPATLCRDGHESLAEWCILQLKEKYGLSAKRGRELLFCVMAINQPLVFLHVTMKWLDKAPPEICFDNKLPHDKAELHQNNLTPRFYRTCAEAGFEPNGGKDPRYTASLNTWPGIWWPEWGRSKKQVALELDFINDTLNLALLLAEVEKDADKVLDAVEKIRGIKGAGSLEFYSTSVTIGLLQSETARRNLFHARLDIASTQHKYLKKMGVDTNKKAKSLLNCTAEHHGIYLKDADNGMCEGARCKRNWNKRDYYVGGQDLFRRQVLQWVDQEGNKHARVEILRKQPEETTWCNYEPPTWEQYILE